jgi:hypothetical protein
MTQAAIMPEERYAAVVEALKSMPGVALAKGMMRSSGQLRVHNRIFAMLVIDRLVVKLPKARVDALVAAGEGVRFDPGHGRVMKEWLSVGPQSREDWLALAREALGFVSGKG